jgi:single-strand DNA-binding protein
VLNLNSVSLAGHLTRDPEVRIIASDRTVASFSLAINRRYKGQDGEFKEEATFVDCEAWGRTAEIVGQYLAKGSPIYLEGRLRLDSWQDKDGQKRQRLKVVADNIQFLGKNRGADGATPAEVSERPLPATRTASTVPSLHAMAEDEQPPF